MIYLKLFLFIYIFFSSQICEVLHSIRDNQESFEELCEKIYLNTKRLFFFDQ
jgi:hypothetical protein